MALDVLISLPTRTSYQEVRYLKDGGSPRRGGRSSLITFAQRDSSPEEKGRGFPFRFGGRPRRVLARGAERSGRGAGFVVHRQKTNNSPFILPPTEPQKAIPSFARFRAPDVLWISFFLSQKSRKLGRVKSSFHGPRGHTEGEERMNTAVPGLENTFGPPLIRLRLAHVILLPISRKIRFSTFRFFPSPFSPSFRNLSNDRQFSPFFFKQEAVKTRNQRSSFDRCNLVEPGRLYRVRSI